MAFPNPPIKQYAIHHSAVSRVKNPVQLYAVDRYHQEKWNMRSELGWYVGYNYFVDVDGTVTHCRTVGEETVANVGHNCDAIHRCDTISICLAGDFNIELPSDKQIASLRQLIVDLSKKFPNIKYTFHRDIQPSRTCPGALYTDQYHRTRILGNVLYPDNEDKVKAEKIAELTQKLDYLRALLARLIARRK